MYRVWGWPKTLPALFRRAQTHQGLTRASAQSKYVVTISHISHTRGAPSFVCSRRGSAVLVLPQRWRICMRMHTHVLKTGHSVLVLLRGRGQ